jgi:hypothetical protein
MRIVWLIPNAIIHLLIVGLFVFITTNAEVLVIIDKFDIWMNALICTFFLNLLYSVILFRWFKPI